MPAYFHSGLIAGLWFVWVAYWTLAARGAKPTRRHDSLSWKLAYIVPLVAGAIIMSLSFGSARWLNARFLPRTDLVFALGIVLLAGGLLVTVWARRHLGRNWSGTITIKHDHALVRTGPYRLVRHPIYSGLFLALIGTAVALGEWRGLIGAAFIIGSFLVKLSLEERILGETFGADYARYRAEVPAVVPRIFAAR